MFESARDAMGYLRIFWIIYAGTLLTTLPIGFDQPLVTILLSGFFAIISTGVGLLVVTIRTLLDKKE